MADDLGKLKLKLELQCTKQSKVSSYAILAMRGTHFSNLPR
jgi:hypothetical protein